MLNGLSYFLHMFYRIVFVIMHSRYLIERPQDLRFFLTTYRAKAILIFCQLTMDDYLQFQIDQSLWWKSNTTDWQVISHWGILNRKLETTTYISWTVLILNFWKTREKISVISDPKLSWKLNVESHMKKVLRAFCTCKKSLEKGV